MKTKNILIALSVALFLAGCLMKSIHPFYSDDKIVFDKELLGTWMDQDSGRWEFSQFMIKRGFMRVDTPDNSYLVKLWDDEEKPSFFNAHLFELGGIKYLDFYPIIKEIQDNDFYSSHILPLHSLAMIETEGDSIICIRWYNEEWVNKIIEENPVSIAYERVGEGGDNTIIVTANTEALQQFLLEYASDTNAFKVDWMGEDKNKEAFSFMLKKQ